jgi:hypothetical protein
MIMIISCLDALVLILCRKIPKVTTPKEKFLGKIPRVVNSEGKISGEIPSHPAKNIRSKTDSLGMGVQISPSAEFRDLRPEFRDPRPEFRDPRPEFRDPSPEARLPISRPES